ncbi:hypothetical protein [Tenacibaculum ovolyticum]|uniref:hypothetical protein n=2 Tax=Tenacibaculum ovolyticum TaxID=104270 RepID=UPI00041C326C|nr:hypothetical protein [Tenacibaculum ovolyticum]
MSKLTKTIGFIFFIFCFACKAIDYKQRSEKTTNELVFVKQKRIIDKELFNKSKKAFLNNLRESVLKERNQKNTDTLLLNNLLSFLGNQFYQDYNDSISTYMYYRVKDSLITSYAKYKGEIIGDYDVINMRNSITYKLAKKDSVTKYLKELYKYNSSINQLKIKEYKDSIKVINGYRCYKVEFNDTEKLEVEGSFFKFNKSYELYVTDELKLKYHPFFRYKEILNKYYPIQIKENISLVNGAYTYYGLVGD